jgi:hypothetical protein
VNGEHLRRLPMAPLYTFDRAPLARLRRTIQRKTLPQVSVEFRESHERENATPLLRVT